MQTNVFFLNLLTDWLVRI